MKMKNAPWVIIQGTNHLDDPDVNFLIMVEGKSYTNCAVWNQKSDTIKIEKKNDSAEENKHEYVGRKQKEETKQDVYKRVMTISI